MSRADSDVRSSIERWRGLKSLVQDAVEHGSRAIERVQKETAQKPFVILEAIPPLRTPTRIVHVIHDTSVSGVHLAIRGMNAAVGTLLDVAIDVVAARSTATPTGEPSPEEEARRDGS